MTAQVRNPFKLTPKQVDEALYKRLQEGQPGGDLLVLSKEYMERRIKQCMVQNSIEPILKHYRSTGKLWKEETELLRKFGCNVDVNEGFGWEYENACPGGQQCGSCGACCPEGARKCGNCGASL